MPGALTKTKDYLFGIKCKNKEKNNLYKLLEEKKTSEEKINYLLDQKDILDSMKELVTYREDCDKEEIVDVNIEAANLAIIHKEIVSNIDNMSEKRAEEYKYERAFQSGFWIPGDQGSTGRGTEGWRCKWHLSEKKRLSGHLDAMIEYKTIKYSKAPTPEQIDNFKEAEKMRERGIFTEEEREREKERERERERERSERRERREKEEKEAREEREEREKTENKEETEDEDEDDRNCCSMDNTGNVSSTCDQNCGGKKSKRKTAKRARKSKKNKSKNGGKKTKKNNSKKAKKANKSKKSKK